MSQQDCQKFEKEINAVSTEKVKKINMPVVIALQEGENLGEWIKPDLNKLNAVGLEKEYVESLKVWIGGCRSILVIWNSDYKEQENAKNNGRKKLQRHLLYVTNWSIRDCMPHLDIPACRRRCAG